MAKPRTYCAQPECEARLERDSKSGVCSRHMHGMYCQCKQCVKPAAEREPLHAQPGYRAHRSSSLYAHGDQEYKPVTLRDYPWPETVEGE